MRAGPIGILADVQGPKLRVGRFQAGRVALQTGQGFRLDLSAVPGDTRRVQLPHPEIIRRPQIGTTLLLDDGKLRLRVVRVRDDHLETEVVTGGPLSRPQGRQRAGRGAADPGADEEGPARPALRAGARRRLHRAELRAAAGGRGGGRAIAAGRAWIMTKMEKPQALDNLDAILALSDAVMVARGDLGVELPPEEVPLAQKRIVRAARQRGLPVVVATQMLESMISAPAPTRAEASDVATAVFDGADAVMLSAETAAGQYPYEAVNMMDRIVDRVERDPGWRATIEATRPAPERSSADAIAAAARQVAHTVGRQGDRRLHRWRQHRAARRAGAAGLPGAGPDQRPATARRLAVVWGVHAVVTPEAHTMTESVSRATRMARPKASPAPGQEVVVTAGVPFGQPGTTNALRVATVK